MSLMTKVSPRAQMRLRTHSAPSTAIAWQPEGAKRSVNGFRIHSLPRPSYSRRQEQLDKLQTLIVASGQDGGHYSEKTKDLRRSRDL